MSLFEIIFYILLLANFAIPVIKKICKAKKKENVEVKRDENKND